MVCTYEHLIQIKCIIIPIVLICYSLCLSILCRTLNSFISLSGFGISFVHVAFNFNLRFI